MPSSSSSLWSGSSGSLTPISAVPNPPLVLVVDKDNQPFNYTPLATISWQECMTALHLERVKTLVAGNRFEVRSGHASCVLPEVVQITSQFPLFGQLAEQPAACTSKNIFRRDLMMCAYSGVSLRKGSLTPPEFRASVDHWATPKSAGGKIQWHNVLTVSATLNSLKGTLSPQEFEQKGYNPLVKPWAPTNKELFVLSLVDGNHPVFYPSWQEFLMPLGWKLTDGVQRVLDGFQRTLDLEKAFST